MMIQGRLARSSSYEDPAPTDPLPQAHTAVTALTPDRQSRMSTISKTPHHRTNFHHSYNPPVPMGYNEPAPSVTTLRYQHPYKEDEAAILQPSTKAYTKALRSMISEESSSVANAAAQSQQVQWLDDMPQEQERCDTRTDRGDPPADVSHALPSSSNHVRNRYTDENRFTDSYHSESCANNNHGNNYGDHHISRSLGEYVSENSSPEQTSATATMERTAIVTPPADVPSRRAARQGSYSTSCRTEDLATTVTGRMQRAASRSPIPFDEEDMGRETNTERGRLRRSSSLDPEDEPPSLSWGYRIPPPMVSDPRSFPTESSEAESAEPAFGRTTPLPSYTPETSILNAPPSIHRAYHDDEVGPRTERSIDDEDSLFDFDQSISKNMSNDNSKTFTSQRDRSLRRSSRSRGASQESDQNSLDDDDDDPMTTLQERAQAAWRRKQRSNYAAAAATAAAVTAAGAVTATSMSRSAGAGTSSKSKESTELTSREIADAVALAVAPDEPPDLAPVVSFGKDDLVHQYDPDVGGDDTLDSTIEGRSLNSLYTKSAESEVEDIIKDIFLIGSGEGTNPGRRKFKHNPRVAAQVHATKGDGTDEETLEIDEGTLDQDESTLGNDESTLDYDTTTLDNDDGTLDRDGDTLDTKDEETLDTNYYTTLENTALNETSTARMAKITTYTGLNKTTRGSESTVEVKKGEGVPPSAQGGALAGAAALAAGVSTRSALYSSSQRATAHSTFTPDAAGAMAEAETSPLTDAWNFMEGKINAVGAALAWDTTKSEHEEAQRRSADLRKEAVEPVLSEESVEYPMPAEDMEEAELSPVATRSAVTTPKYNWKKSTNNSARSKSATKSRSAPVAKYSSPVQSDTAETSDKVEVSSSGESTDPLETEEAESGTGWDMLQNASEFFWGSSGTPCGKDTTKLHKQCEEVASTDRAVVRSQESLDADARVRELALQAAVSVHQMNGYDFYRTKEIDMVRDIRFSVVDLTLPLGLIFQENEKGCWVTKILSEGSASKTNGSVQIGDQLAAVDGANAVDMTVDDIAKIVGNKTDAVELTFIRYIGELEPEAGSFAQEEGYEIAATETQSPMDRKLKQRKLKWSPPVPSKNSTKSAMRSAATQSRVVNQPSPATPAIVQAPKSILKKPKSQQESARPVVAAIVKPVQEREIRGKENKKKFRLFGRKKKR